VERSKPYACNGINGGIVSHAGRKVAGTLVVKCPQSLSPSSGALAGSISIVPKGNEIDKVEYNLENFLECEQKDIALFANTSTIMTGSRSFKQGSRLVLQEDEKKRLNGQSITE